MEEISKIFIVVGRIFRSLEYIVSFSKRYPEYNDYFRHVYVHDESYFHTIVYNSEYIKKTPRQSVIPETESSVESLLNLTYFEYPSTVRGFRKKSMSF